MFFTRAVQQMLPALPLWAGARGWSCCALLLWAAARRRRALPPPARAAARCPRRVVLLLVARRVRAHEAFICCRIELAFDGAVAHGTYAIVALHESPTVLGEQLAPLIATAFGLLEYVAQLVLVHVARVLDFSVRLVSAHAVSAVQFVFNWPKI